MQVGGGRISVGKPVSRKLLRKTRFHRISKGLLLGYVKNQVRRRTLFFVSDLQYGLWRISTNIHNSGSMVVISALIPSNHVFFNNFGLF